LPPHAKKILQAGHFEQELHNVKGVFSVKPRSALVDGSRVWGAKGISLFVADPTERMRRTHSEKSAEFSKCEALAVQDKTSGKITAQLVRTNAQDCPPYASALLLSSITEMSGVVTGHVTSKPSFSHRSTAHDDDRRVDYFVQKGVAGRKKITGLVHHRFFNAKSTPGSDFYDFSDHLTAALGSHHHSSITSEVDGDSLLQHTLDAKITVAPPREEDASRSPDLFTHRKVQNYASPDAALHITFSFKKVREEPAPTLTQMPLSTTQFVEQAKAKGFQTGSSQWPETPERKKPNPFASMTPMQQVKHFNLIVSEIPVLPFKLAQNRCQQMLSVPAGLDIFMAHLKDKKTEFNVKSSGALLNALGSLKPMPMKTIQKIASDNSIHHVPREQALLTLMQPNCNTERLNINVLKWLHTLSVPAINNKPFGLHTSALHIKHGLVAQSLKCAKDSQGALMPELLELVTPTEQALQRSLASQDWVQVESHLISLGNSRLARHTPFVKQVLDQHSNLPAITKKVLEATLKQLNGVDAKNLMPTAKNLLQVQALGNEEYDNGDTDHGGITEDNKKKRLKSEGSAGIKYDWEWKFPPDGKKLDADGKPLPKEKQGSDPTFQAIPKIELGANTKDGLYVTLDFSVKLFGNSKNQYSIVEFNIKSMPSVTKKPALAKPTVTLKLAGIQVYTNGAADENSRMKDGTKLLHGTGENDRSELNSPDGVGYCETDVKSLKGGSLAWAATALFYKAPPIRITLGPVPIKIEFKMEGSLGFNVGVGALGGDSKYLTEYQMFDKPAKNKNDIQCGDGSDFKKGLLAYLQPEAAIAVDGSAGIDCLLVTIGLGLNIKLIEVKIPAGVDINIGGKGATCFGMKFKANAFSGRGYVFFDSWFTGRKEWDLFEWDGPGWSYPTGKQLLGGCNAKAGIPEYTPPEEPEPSDVDCQVGFYAGKFYGGDVNYRYYVASSNQKEYKDAGTCGEKDDKYKCGMKTLPSQIEGEVMSVKTFGNCRSVELVDNDNGAVDKNGMNYGLHRYENGMIWYDQGGIPELPWDLQSDVRAVFIRALPPRGYQCQKYVDNDPKKNCLKGKFVKKTDLPKVWITTPFSEKTDEYPKGQPELEWHSSCFVFTYRYPDFIGFIYMMHTKKQGTYSKQLDVESIQLSPGCKEVKLYDNDWSGSEDDQVIAGSLALLEYDLRRDIKRYDLWAYGMDEAKPDPEQQCIVEIFCNERYSRPVGKLISPIPTFEGQGFFEAAPPQARDCVRSLKLSKGCQKVLLYDDDSSGQCNPYIYGGIKDLNYFQTASNHESQYWDTRCHDSASDDLEDDIKAYKLFPKYVDRAAQIEKQKMAAVNKYNLASTVKVNDEIKDGLNDPVFKARASAPTNNQQCWMCEQFERDSMVGYTRETCWKGSKDEGKQKCASAVFEEIRARRGSQTAEQCLMKHHDNWKGYTCEQARNYCSWTPKSPCEWTRGDAKLKDGSDKDKKVGSEHWRHNCENIVKANHPTATGATWDDQNGNCWAEFGDITGTLVHGNYDTCKFAGWKDHVQECCGCVQETVTDIDCRCHNFQQQDKQSKAKDEAYKKEIEQKAKAEGKDYYGEAPYQKH
jgi:hypothetical protein